MIIMMTMSNCERLVQVHKKISFLLTSNLLSTDFPVML